jgi:hypothetical protein
MRDYCQKYPTDPGEHDINEEDVAILLNHKWAEHALQTEEKLKTDVGIPTYGTCSICWNSGPVYMKCIECGAVGYQVMHFRHYIRDSQTIAKLLGNKHKIAKANRLQHWIRT